MTTYDVIIGMEVHIELQTNSKMFCGCDAHFFGAPPNSHTCPVCLGMPGALPVINEQAVAFTVLTGLATHCQIHPHNVFARKNYFYPDLPKGYQISQYELPLCTAGHLPIEVDGAQKIIGITRIHLEEDTGKLTHVDGGSLVDLNRAGVPLMEIVSEPDLRSADEAYAYVSKLRQIVRYLGVSSGDMEKGAMRCEVNLSLKPAGSDQWGTKVEIKNLNSFRSVRDATLYEIARQTEVLNNGGEIAQVTMGWDEDRRQTVVQRSKEDAHDYRYFPEPDLPPLHLDNDWIMAVTAQLPELPDAKLSRYQNEWDLPAQDAALLVDQRERAEYFEAAVAAASAKNIAPKTVSNWTLGEIFRLLNETDSNQADIPVPVTEFAALLALVEKGAISRNVGKDVLAEMWRSGDSAASIVERRGLSQISDERVLDQFVAQVIAAQPDAVAQYRAGKTKVVGFLVGQVMRLSKGKANPKLVEQTLRQKLSDP